MGATSSCNASTKIHCRVQLNLREQERDLPDQTQKVREGNDKIHCKVQHTLGDQEKCQTKLGRNPCKTQQCSGA